MLMLFKQIFNNIIAIGSSDVINKGTFLLFNIIVARNLPVKEYGLFSLSISISIYLWSVADGGITSHATKMAAQLGKRNLERIVSFAVPIKLVLSLLTSLVVGIFLIVLHLSFYESLIYLSAALYLIAMSFFPAWIMRGVQDNLGYFIVYVFLSVCAVLFLLFWLSLDFSDKNALSAIVCRNLSWLIGAFLSCFWAIKRLDLQVEFFAFYFDFKIVKSTYPLCMAAILYSFIPLIPQLVLRFSGLFDALGKYGAIWQIQRILLSGALVFSSSFMPMLAKYFIRKDLRFIRKLILSHFIVLFFTTLLIFILYNIYGLKIVNILYGKIYSIPRELLFIFSLVLLIVFFRASIDSILIVCGRYMLMAVNGLVVIVSMIILSFILKNASIIESGLIYFVGELLLLVFNLFLVLKTLKYKIRSLNNENIKSNS